MAGVATELKFVGSGASGAGNPQTDRTLWLGGDRASTTIRQAQPATTLTQTAQTRNILVADALPGGIGTSDRDLVGWWAFVRDGAAFGHASRISEYRASDRRIMLEQGAPANVVSGDEFSLYEPGAGLFPNVAAAEAADGGTLYRCVFFHNGELGAFTDARIYLLPLQGPSEFFRFGLSTSAFNTTYTIADEATSPLHANGGYTSTTGFSSPTPFGNHVGEPAAVRQTGISMGAGGYFPLWIERAIDTTTPLRNRASVAVGLSFASATTPDDRGGDLIVFDVEGFEATVVYSFANRLHPKGGSRAETLLTTSSGGVLGVPVRFGIIGPGTSKAPDDPTTGYDETDASGAAEHAYTAPTDESDEGRFVTGFSQFSDAVQVGNPSSVELAPAIAITVGATVVLTVI